jgi:hypothetical protein
VALHFSLRLSISPSLKSFLARVAIAKSGGLDIRAHFKNSIIATIRTHRDIVNFPEKVVGIVFHIGIIQYSEPKSSKISRKSQKTNIPGSMLKRQRPGPAKMKKPHSVQSVYMHGRSEVGGLFGRLSPL